MNRLLEVDDPERFVWRILPHAARTFSACIVLLPASMARATAVAYLYCRILDTYEDLLVDPKKRRDCMTAMRHRFEPGKVEFSPLPELDPFLARDERERTHVLLVNQHRMVDEVFRSLDEGAREVIRDLVTGMAEGMMRSSTLFEEQGGALLDGDQLTDYCRGVLGLPIVFAARLLTLAVSGHASITRELEENALLSGELIQLANITRDIEKDLERGVAYHPALAAEVGKKEVGLSDRSAAILSVRTELLDRGLSLAPSYGRMFGALPFRFWSLSRASALLMLSFTERYYRGARTRVGLPVGRGLDSGLGIILASLPAVFLPGHASRRVRKIVNRMTTELRRGEPRSTLRSDTLR